MHFFFQSARVVEVEHANTKGIRIGVHPVVDDLLFVGSVKIIQVDAASDSQQVKRLIKTGLSATSCPSGGAVDYESINLREERPRTITLIEPKPMPLPT